MLEDLVFDLIEEHNLCNKKSDIIKHKFESNYRGIDRIEILLEPNHARIKLVKLYGNTDIMCLINEYYLDYNFMDGESLNIYVYMSNLGIEKWDKDILDPCFMGFLEISMSSIVRDNLNLIYPFMNIDYRLEEREAIEISLSQVSSVLKYLGIKFNSFEFVYYNLGRGEALYIFKDIISSLPILYKYIKFININLDTTMMQLISYSVFADKKYLLDMFKDLNCYLKPNRFKLTLTILPEADIESIKTKGGYNNLFYFIKNSLFYNNYCELVYFDRE